jgi:membrane associated rhomboid family serine protease
MCCQQPVYRESFTNVHLYLRNIADGNGRWTISYQGAPAMYVSSDAGPAGTVAPPAAGWAAKGIAAQQGSAPAVTAAWRLQPAAAKKKGKSKAGRAASGLATLLAMPGTTLLLFLNLWVAFVLWSRKVDPGAVAVSYDAVVSDREYWRCVTASFSHFEALHLGFNMMSLYNMGQLEQVCW